TLRRLAATQWGSAPMICLASRSVEWLQLFRQVNSAVNSAHLKQIDYLLFLHDDLEFNRWLRHNVCQWLRCYPQDQLLASLSNPGLAAEACDVHNYAYLASPGENHSSQAFIISTRLFRSVATSEKTKLHSGDERPLLARLADALNQPVTYHCPSLVQIREETRNAFGQLKPAVDYGPA